MMGALRRLTRMVADLPAAVWLLAGTLLVAPWYLAYVAWILTRVGGVETFIPRTP